MKRLLSLMLCCALLLATAACGPAAQPEELERTAARAAEDMAAGRFQDVVDAMSPDCAQRPSIPLLVLLGDADFQLSVERDYQSWRDALAGKQNASYRVYGGLNHLFLKSTGARDLTDYDQPGHIGQNVLDDIFQWVHTH